MISYSKKLGGGLEFQIVSGDDIQDTYAKSNKYASSCMTTKEGVKAAEFYSYVNNLYCGRFLYEGKTVIARSLIWLAHKVRPYLTLEMDWKKPDAILRDIVYYPDNGCYHLFPNSRDAKDCVSCKLYNSFDESLDDKDIGELLDSCIKSVMKKRYPTLQYYEYDYNDDVFEEFLVVKVKKHPKITKYPYVDCFRLLSVDKSYLSTLHCVMLDSVGGRGSIMEVENY